ncbi:hypothetical protein Tco_1217707 [Tanacetum coccineum]
MKCLSDESLVIPLEELRVDHKLHFVEEPMEVMDREIKQMKRSRIPIIKVMAALIISISFDSSDESVGYVMPRVILFGTILTEVPVVPADLHVAPEVSAATVAAPTGVLELESHSSSETGPSESPIPPVPVAPMVSLFLCLDDSESEPAAVLLERLVSFVAHDAMVGRWRSRVMSRPFAPSESSSFSASFA